MDITLRLEECATGQAGGGGGRVNIQVQQREGTDGISTLYNLRLGLKWR